MTLEEATYNKFKHIYKVVTSQSFLSMSSLQGDIPFWIAPYDIKSEKQVVVEIDNLEKKLLNDGVRPLVIDLFELSCSIIDENIGLIEMFELEKDMEKIYFKDALQSTINIHERLIPAIIKLVEEAQPKMLLLKGVGLVYPFIRSHTVLNNLQSAVKHLPVVMFYPGEYSGLTLRLFGEFEDDNYYRASNIDSQKI
jgi:hypothetical protein